jgi:hypothetical protein
MKNEKHFLDGVKWGVIPVVNYRGCHVVKNLKTGLYSVLGRTGVSVEEVDGVIDGGLKSLESGIERGGMILRNANPSENAI